MKKAICPVLAAVLVASLVFAFTACSGGGGKLVCGITDYEPMNFKDSSGNWTGFDTEFARLVGDKLGMEVEFQMIDWGQKFQELESGAITCIWNGFTANTDDDGVPRVDQCDMTYSYMLNQQCVVVKSSRVGEFLSSDDLSDKKIAAEGGSAGEEAAKDASGPDGSIIAAATQTATFIEVRSGAVDCAIVDILLAQKIAGTGDYTDLTIADIELGAEVYAVGFKKGSDLTAKVNNAMKELYDSGALQTLAQKYKLENSLLLDTNFGKK